MVWNTQNSPLYRTVESFNSGAWQAPTDSAPGQECGCAPEPTGSSTSGAQRRQDCCSGQASRADTAYSAVTGSPGGFLQRLTGDRDSLLIIALIVLLLHEKADMKLIAALAFILLT